MWSLPLLVGHSHNHPLLKIWTVELPMFTDGETEVQQIEPLAELSILTLETSTLWEQVFLGPWHRAPGWQGQPHLLSFLSEEAEAIVPSC